MPKRTTLALSLLLAPTALVVPGTASAASARATTPEADSHSNVLEEVVVTAARRRTENVQKTPIAITALNAALLERAHVTNLAQIGQLAPNLQISKNISTADVAAVYLRGFGTFGADIATEPKVAIFLDGIYQPATIGTLLDTFDIGQIEVQAGPQGTLLGKNSPIGAIYVTSAPPPKAFAGVVEADYGSYNHFGIRGRVGGPVWKDATGRTILAAKVSFVDKQGGNFVYDTLQHKRDFGGDGTVGGRVSLAFTPTDNFDWNLTSVVLNSNGPQAGARSVGYEPAVLGNRDTVAQPAAAECFFVSCAPTPYGTTQSGFTDHPQGKTVEVASTMNYRLAPVTLTMVTGYDAYWRVDNEDVGGVAIPVLNNYAASADFKEETEEVRVSSTKGGGLDLNGALDWVMGGYFSNLDYRGVDKLGILSPPGVVSLYQAEFGNTKSEAAFVHAIYHVTPKWSFTGGVRESWDEKTHSYIIPSSFSDPAPEEADPPASFRNTSFEAGTSYQIDSHKLVYFRFAQGYAAGGFVGFPGCAGCGNIYQPETNNAYEVGLKSDWLQNRLRVNLDVFRNDLANLQVEGTVATALPPFYLQTTTNAATATVQGIEGQVIAVPVPALTTHVNFGYLDPQYHTYLGTVCSNVTGVATDCSGVPFSFAPKWTIGAGADYVYDVPREHGSITLSGSYDYKSTLYTSDAPIPASRQPGYGLLNMGVKYVDPSERYAFEVYGTNILDKHYIASATSVPGLLLAVNDGRPAEWGIRLTYKFGS